MQPFNFRYYNTKFLIGVISFLAIAISWASDWLDAQGIFTGVSIVGTIGILVFVIDKYLWKYPVFKLLLWIPNMNGRYEGEILFFHPIYKTQDKKNCVIEIIQTGSKIKVNSYFENNGNSERTISKSRVESVVKNEDETCSLILTYQNKGILDNPNFPPHFGTNILKYIDNTEGKFLKGEYYTSREPQTKGRIEVKFISHKLKNDY